MSKFRNIIKFVRKKNCFDFLLLCYLGGHEEVEEEEHDQHQEGDQRPEQGHHKHAHSGMKTTF